WPRFRKERRAAGGGAWEWPATAPARTVSPGGRRLPRRLRASARLWALEKKCYNITKYRPFVLRPAGGHDGDQSAPGQVRVRRVRLRIAAMAGTLPVVSDVEQLTRGAGGTVFLPNDSRRVDALGGGVQIK